VLKLFRYVCNLLMLIVEDRRYVDVPSYSVKFDSSYRLIHPLSWGLMHLFMSIAFLLGISLIYDLIVYLGFLPFYSFEGGKV
jgi:hypothetical protein